MDSECVEKLLGRNGISERSLIEIWGNRFIVNEMFYKFA